MDCPTDDGEEDDGLAGARLAAVVAWVRRPHRLEEQGGGELLLLGEQSEHV